MGLNSGGGQPVVGACLPCSEGGRHAGGPSAASVCCGEEAKEGHTTAAGDAFFGCAAGATPLKAMSNYLINTPDADLSSELGASRYGAITIADTGTGDSSFAYNIMVNASSTQGPGIFMNLVNSASLMTLVGSTDAYIKTNNHPLPATNKENR